MGQESRKGRRGEERKGRIRQGFKSFIESPAAGCEPRTRVSFRIHSRVAPVLDLEK